MTSQAARILKAALAGQAIAAAAATAAAEARQEPHSCAAAGCFSCFCCCSRSKILSLSCWADVVALQELLQESAVLTGWLGEGHLLLKDGIQIFGNLQGRRERMAGQTTEVSCLATPPAICAGMSHWDVPQHSAGWMSVLRADRAAALCAHMLL